MTAQERQRFIHTIDSIRRQVEACGEDDCPSCLELAADIHDLESELSDEAEAGLHPDPDDLPAEAYDPDDARDIGYGEPR